jgi:hypothetical protein
MTAGLQLFNSGGALMFDSTYATGGVCLGFYSIPPSGATFTFPDIAGTQGMALYGTGATVMNYTFDTGLGYPRFTFPAASGGYSVVLFAA